VLAQLHKRELLTDDAVAQILSQDHTGFGVWMGDPLHDKESEQFVARYIERKRSAESVIALSCTKVEEYPHALQHRATN